LLKGLLFDARGSRMTPSSARKNGAHYRYYVSCCLHQGRKDLAATRARVSAPEIEAVVLQALGDLAAGTPNATEQRAPEDSRVESVREHPVARVERIILNDNGIDILIRSESEHLPSRAIAVPWTPTRHRPRRLLIGPALAQGPKPIRSETRARLVQGIANARTWLDELMTGKASSTTAIANREGCSERHIRMTLNLAFLSPKIVKAAVDGTLPAGTGVVSLIESAPCWASQDRQMLGTRSRDIPPL
jgi:hypothetical protein